jgi:hypothetical protein
LKVDAVFLKRFAAPECVFILYPIINFSSFLEVKLSLIVVFPQVMALDQLEQFLLSLFQYFQEAGDLNYY